MKLGVIGLPNVGKSTLFNAITKAGAAAANYPFCTIEPNVGVVAVPDERLEKLAALYNSKKITPTSLEFVDIAGLVKGASKGEGLGNKFLSHIREVDAVVHTVRCFYDDNVIHVDGAVDPVRDVETINLELILADMEILERRIAKAKSAAKGGDKKFSDEAAFYGRIYSHLEKELPARTMKLTDDEREQARDLFLLTAKPVIYAANVSEDAVNGDNDLVRAVKAYAEKEGSGTVVISAKIEEELAQFSDDERGVFMEELGLKESGLQRLVSACYSLLGLISYLTAGEKEVRAWTIERGTKAPAAAGKIHSDFEKGFIRAEIVKYHDLIESGSFNAAREQGKIRSEGKEYVMQEDDVVLFRFNV
ncbi:MAG: redox-regulated ATPase YchF [Clostridiales bacterium]|jgi:GTP-binding protein YchF|nr:redox-regulated ATPase YchF [Clostridiales bacterium]